MILQNYQNKLQQGRSTKKTLNHNLCMCIDWHACLYRMWCNFIFCRKREVEGIEVVKAKLRFFALGEQWSVTEHMVDNYCEFVCALYRKRIQDVDLLRYQLYCTKCGKMMHYHHAKQRYYSTLKGQITKLQYGEEQCSQCQKYLHLIK